MSFDRTRSLGVPLEVLPRTGSTNADLLAAAASRPNLATIVTLEQTAGRGRLDRTWVAPPGETLAVSVLVRADLGAADRGWLPLVAGTAMRDAIAAVLPEGRVGVKWPNDVLAGSDPDHRRKVCGILAQVAADGSVVVGAGVNLTIAEHDLPTSNATSLRLEGADGDADVLADDVLAGYWAALRAAIDALIAGGPAADALRTAVRGACETIGRRVRVELPGGAVTGDAVGIDDDGRLQFRNGGGEISAISVGDVTHLRYA